jgi:hypothetical protein
MAEPQIQQPRRRPKHGLLYLAGAALLTYLIGAYVIVPLAWKRETRHHLDPSNGSRITHTPDGILGDPVNLALLGSESEVVYAMTAAKWYPADAITFRGSVRIAVDSVFRRPDDDAPVSTLELFGLKQDLAFEQPQVTQYGRRAVSMAGGQSALTCQVGSGSYVFISEASLLVFVPRSF